jgi:cpsA protein
MAKKVQMSGNVGQSRLNIFKLVNMILTLVLLGLGIVVLWTMYSQNFLNFRGINYILTIGVIAAIILGIYSIIKRKVKVLSTILLFLMNIILIFAYLQFRTAINLFDSLNSTAAVSEYTMSIVVLKDSNIDSLEDIGEDNVAAPVSSDGENINEFMKNIHKKNNNKIINLVETRSYISAYEKLEKGENKVMILNSAHESFVTSQYTDFSEKTKKIYEYKITKEVITKAKINPGDTFNVYISGIDTYGTISSVARSDVNIIMTVNRKTGKILLTTTPRDAYVRIADSGNNQYDKLTHAGIYGVDTSIHTLENLYDLKIDYYARLNFTSFIKIIDIIGGVDVYNEQNFVSSIGNYTFEPGMVHLDSAHALAFVRERYSLIDGDNDRGKNQEKVITAMIRKLSTREGISNYNSIIKELAEALQTNMPLETAMNLANEQLTVGKDYIVRSQALIGTGRMGLTSYAMPEASLYMTQIDDESLNEVKDNIKNVLEGR